ncbi:MAG: exonuclease subunit SbcD, partial [Deltaproteobacteria bacterium]
MRLLHTSDWHLGASYDGLSLLPDHERFLDWLIDALVAWEVDALLVAGDVFDQAHPSAEAQRAFFRFLARLRGTGHRCSVVLTGGNHDSARRLRAPGDLLDALDIHVHAHLPPDGTLDPLLVPLPDAAAPQAVIAAVPYVHEYRLGVRTMDHAEGGLHAAITAAFADLYGRLAERARARWGPDVPLVAMGHLTVGGGADPADSPHAIHQAGSIEALPPSLFGDAWASIVLGHIHRAYPVDASRRCWYSGTPVALTPREGETARRVRVLDLCAGGAEAPAEVPGLEPSPGTSAGGAVNRAGGEERARSWEAVPGGWLCQRTVTVPAWRTMRVVSGTEEEVVAAVRGAAWAGELS